MNTNNICFCREIRKILCGHPILSVAMIFLPKSKVFTGQASFFFELRLNNTFNNLSIM